MAPAFLLSATDVFKCTSNLIPIEGNLFFNKYSGLDLVVPSYLRLALGFILYIDAAVSCK